MRKRAEDRRCSVAPVQAELTRLQGEKRIASERLVNLSWEESYCRDTIAGWKQKLKKLVPASGVDNWYEREIPTRELSRSHSVDIDFRASGGADISALRRCSVTALACLKGGVTCSPIFLGKESMDFTAGMYAFRQSSANAHAQSKRCQSRRTVSVRMAAAR